MGGGGLDGVRPPRPLAAQAFFRPVDAVRADAGCESGIGRDEQDEAAPAAEPCELSPVDEVNVAMVAPDDAEAARQAAHDAKNVRRAGRVGEEEGPGKGAAISRAGRPREARRRKKLAAGRGLRLRG